MDKDDLGAWWILQQIKKQYRCRPENKGYTLFSGIGRKGFMYGKRLIEGFELMSMDQPRDNWDAPAKIPSRQEDINQTRGDLFMGYVNYLMTQTKLPPKISSPTAKVPWTPERREAARLRSIEWRKKAKIWAKQREFHEKIEQRELRNHRRREKYLEDKLEAIARAHGGWNKLADKLFTAPAGLWYDQDLIEPEGNPCPLETEDWLINGWVCSMCHCRKCRCHRSVEDLTIQISVVY